MEHRAGEIACDELLFERLVHLRKQLADERAVPPHILFSDVSLRQIARDYPADEPALARISGMSVRKLQEFGQVVLAVIMGHLETQPRQIFADTSFEEPAAVPGWSRRIAAADEGPYNKELFERLREVRAQLATKRGLPAYFILHDSALRQMARVYPATEDEFAQIPTVGPKKANDFAALFVAAILEHLERSPRQR